MIQESIAIAKQITRIDPDYTNAHEFLAKNNPSSLSKNQLPSDISGLESIALSKFNNGHFSEAIHIFNQIIDIQPKHAAAHRYLAEIYTSQDDYDTAISHLNYLTLLFPKDYRVYYNLGIVCYYMGDDKRALSNLNQAFKLCTDDEQFLSTIQHMMHTIELKNKS